MRKQRLQTQVNHAFFDEIDSPQRAYVLGFFVADGHIHVAHTRRGSGYELGFSSNDREHLELIRRTLVSEHTIYGHGSGCFRLLIGSKSLMSALKRLGYTSRKSYEAHMPDIPANVISHFARGLFDGDGCITRGLRKKDGQPYVNIHFNGTEALMKQLAEVIPQKVSGVREAKKNVWRISFSFRKALSVLDWLYLDSLEFSSLDYLGICRT
jgi:hypothetical protein